MSVTVSDRPRDDDPRQGQRCRSHVDRSHFSPLLLDWPELVVSRSGQGDNADPKAFDLLNHSEKLRIIHWLGDVAVGVQVVAPDDVLIRRGRGQHDDRDPLERRALLDLGQYLTAIHDRQIEIQQDQAGARRIDVRTTLEQEIHRFLAIGHHVQLVLEFALLDRLPRQADVARIVFDQQDMDGVHAVMLSWGATAALTTEFEELVVEGAAGRIGTGPGVAVGEG